MEVHRILGKGLLEVVYKDAIEYEFKNQKIPYEREKKYEVEYKGIILPHYFLPILWCLINLSWKSSPRKGIADEL